QEQKLEKLRIIDNNGTLVGLITFKDIEKKMNYPHACKDDMGRLRVGAAVGVTSDTAERVEALMESGVDIITIDTAHGHSSGVLEMVEQIKDQFPDLDLIEGNIATKERSEEH